MFTWLDDVKDVKLGYFLEEFGIKWQGFKFIERKNLEVSGLHEHNAAIGQYAVTIRSESNY